MHNVSYTITKFTQRIQNTLSHEARKVLHNFKINNNNNSNEEQHINSYMLADNNKLKYN